MSAELRLRLAEEDADPERLGELARMLRADLAQLNVDTIKTLPAGEPPTGVRGLDAAVVGGLLVSFHHAAEVLQPIVLAVQEWVARGHGASRTVRLEIGGDVLELSNATAAEQARLAEFFVRRHTAEDGAR